MYRPEEGATHREQSILKPDHFQISLVQIGHNQEDEEYESDISEQVDSVRIKLLSSKAKMPTKGSTTAAGHDLYAMDEVLIPAKGQTLVDTGLAIGLPSGTYARIAPRSGLAHKKRINVGGGVIDAELHWRSQSNLDEPRDSRLFNPSRGANCTNNCCKNQRGNSGPSRTSDKYGPLNNRFWKHRFEPQTNDQDKSDHTPDKFLAGEPQRQ